MKQLRVLHRATTQGMHIMQKYGWPVWLVTVILLAGVLRTYRIDAPLADWHAWRQVDTASVTREFVENGVSVLYPRYHDVSNIPSGQLNLEGWRMVEFPLLNAVTAWLLLLQPEWSLVSTSRAVSIVSFLFTLFFFGEVVRRWYGKTVAVVTTLLMAVLPYSIFFTRIILPEPFLLLWVSATAYFVLLWVEARNRVTKQKTTHWWHWLYLLIAVGTFAVALLVKPMAVFWLPVIAAAYLRRTQWQWKEVGAVIVGVAASVAPVWWWREWIQQFPAGIPASDWLFNSNDIRLKPAWWRWLFGDRFGRMWFGNWGAGILALGVVAALPENMPRWQRKWHKNILELWYWKRSWLAQEGLVWASVIGIMSFLIIFATGNVQHDYYQTPLIPLVCLLWARGAVWVWRTAPSIWQKFGVVAGLSTVLLLSLAFSWYELKGNFNINNPDIIVAGQAVQRLTPEDALVIAPYQGDTTFLFATHRWGWPIGFSIEEKRADGAEFYITTTKDDEANMLRKQFPVVEETDQYLLLDLRTPISTQEAEAKE